MLRIVCDAAANRESTNQCCHFLGPYTTVCEWVGKKKKTAALFYVYMQGMMGKKVRVTLLVPKPDISRTVHKPSWPDRVSMRFTSWERRSYAL
jgi:hypothetical protein